MHLYVMSAGRHAYPEKPSYLAEPALGNVNVAMAHLHVDPQAFHGWKAVLVVPKVLWMDAHKRAHTHTHTISLASEASCDPV